MCGKVKITYSGLKMLETIITQDFFYYLGLLALTFTIDRTTVEGGGYLFNSSWGTNFFWQRIYGEVILNGTTNDQIMPRWGGSFSPWFFLHYWFSYESGIQNWMRMCISWYVFLPCGKQNPLFFPVDRRHFTISFLVIVVTRK